MTYKEAKEELMSVKFIKADIRMCQEEINKLRSDLLFTSSVIMMPDSNNPTTSSADRIRYKLDEALIRYDSLIDHLGETKRRIESRIFDVNMENKLQGQVLKMRFLYDKKLEEIAVELNYNYSWIRHTACRAIVRYAALHSCKVSISQEDTQKHMSIG